MAPYKSRLNSVLEERKARQDQIQRELAVEKQSLIREEAALQKMIEAKQAALEGLRERQSRPGLPAELEVYYQFVRHQANKISLQEEVVSAKKQRFEAKRKALEKVNQEKKMIENIESKRKDLFIASVKKKESDFLDEVGGRIKRRGLE